MKILFISPVFPFPATSGDRQRTDLILKALRHLGEVDLIVGSFSAVPTGFNVDLPAQMGVSEYLFLSPKTRIGKWFRRLRLLIGRLIPSLGMYAVDQRLRRLVSDYCDDNDYNCIVVRYLSAACWVDLPGKYNIPVYLDCDDYPPDNLRSEFKSDAFPLSRRFLAVISYLSLKRYIDKKLQAFDGIWVSNLDNKINRSLEKAMALSNIPWGDVPRSASSAIDGDDSVLVVTSNNQGNMRGLGRFINTAWPLVIERRPRAVLRIVGAMPEVWLGKWRGLAGVEVVGFVDSLQDEYQRSAVVIAPVASGAGTNIKVLESLIMRRCCIMSPVAARGQQFLDEISSDELLASSIPEMAERIVYLLEHPERRRLLEDQLHAWATENCNHETFNSQVAKMFA